MTLDYFIYDVATGAILRRLTAPAGRDRKANTYEGEAAILATVDGVPSDTHRVDLATRTLVSIDPA